MAEFRAGALIKVAAPVSVPFDDHLHTSLLSDLDAIPVSSSVLVLDDDHPLRAAFDHPAPPTKIHLVNLPGPIRVEILWWATRALSVGTAISGAAVNWLDTHWTKVALLLSDGHRPPPQSMLERTHDEWTAAVRHVRVRAGAPLGKNSVDARLNALIGRLCQALQIACLPQDWWEHDLWVPGLDRRIPIRPVEPSWNRTCSWARIRQPWLRSAAKWHCRVALETGRFRWSTVLRKAECLTRFSQFLAEVGIDDPLLVRDVEVELPGLALDFLSWLQRQPNRMGDSPLSKSFCRDIQSVVGPFYTDLFTHRVEVAKTLSDDRWRSLSPFHASILTTAHRLRTPRFRERLNSFEPDVLRAINAHIDIIGMPKEQSRTVIVNGQPTEVQGIGDPQALRIYLLLLRLGRRANEVLLLDRDPLIPLAGLSATAGGEGAFVARLRYAQTKIDNAPDTIPVEADVVGIVREQQEWLARREESFSNGARSRWLFVRPQQNRLGLAPYAYSTLLGRVQRLSAAIQLKDSEGNPVALTRTHQFRHTKATSLLNAGVPLTVIQRYLGHVTPNMTAHYAKLRDHTMQEAFLALEKVRADGTPSRIATSDLYEVLQLDRRTDRILPNGWCLLPPRQTCEKGNACLTCDLFVTDRSHLDALSRQQETTGALIDERRAEFETRFGQPMGDDHVWLEPRLREARALEGLLAALAEAQTVRGAGVPGRSDGTSTLINITPKPT